MGVGARVVIAVAGVLALVTTGCTAPEESSEAGGAAGASASSITSASPRTTSPDPTGTDSTSPGPTVDPADFTAAVAGVTAGDLGETWHPGCPVGPDELRQVTLTHWTFDGDVAEGRIVMHADLVDPTIAAFERLHELRFPIRQMVPVSEFGGDTFASLGADNTYGFHCRNAVTTGPPRWSQHAFGRAIDVNPLLNPYILQGEVIPAEGAGNVERVDEPGYLLAGSPQLAAFTDSGFEWGGVWNNPDYMHLQFP